LIRQLGGRLHLKLVCRTLDWTLYQESERQVALLLKRNAVTTEEGESIERPVYTLCPLTRSAITLAVQEFELDPEGFFTAIFKARVAELAAYPFTLKMLLREFARGQIHSKTRRMLYESYARALCDESYESLRRALPAFNAYLIPRGERLFFAAELLAAVMIVTGRDSVQLNADKPAPSACLRLEDILSVAETIDTGAGPKVSQSELQSALGTAIFTDRGAKRFGFVHRTMAECLSARRYTVMELRRLRPLFFQGPVTERHVVPQLAQTASWLCEDHPQFFEAVLECDVEVLLRRCSTVCWRSSIQAVLTRKRSGCSASASSVERSTFTVHRSTFAAAVLLGAVRTVSRLLFKGHSCKNDLAANGIQAGYHPNL
jgi:hypothetical protein